MKIAILVSGRGSNMKALVASLSNKHWQAIEPQICVAANLPCPAVDWADARDFATWKPAMARDYQERELVACLEQFQPDIICLAGFMRLLSPGFVKRWQGQIINIHPSLLPAYPGLNTHQRVLAAGERKHGCTLHYVDEGMDTGEIIAQAEVAVLENDTVESLAARVLEQEHQLYAKVLKNLMADLVLDPQASRSMQS